MLLRPLYNKLFNKNPEDDVNIQNLTEVSLDLSDVCNEVLQLILLRMDKKTLVNCRNICHQWKDIIDSKSFWLSKEELDGESYLRELFSSSSICPENYAKLSILRPYNRNLLSDKNPNNVQFEYLKHADPRWFFDHGWKYEEPPVFLNEHFDKDFEPLFNHAFATSYYLCSKKMDLDMKTIGVDDEILDKYRPPIVFTEYVSHRSDCGSMYRMFLKFYDEHDACLASETQEISFEQWAPQKWHKMEVVLKSYPAGCRTLRVYSAGRDTQYWAGHYGTKIAGSSLIIKLESSPESLRHVGSNSFRTQSVE